MEERERKKGTRLTIPVFVERATNSKTKVIKKSTIGISSPSPLSCVISMLLVCSRGVFRNNNK